MEEQEMNDADLTDLLIRLLPYGEKKRFRGLCGTQDKTSAKMLTVLMDKFEGKEDGT